MRLAADTGGTFTDLAVETDGEVRFYKASTTPQSPAEGILDAVRLAAEDLGRPIESLLAEAGAFIHGTTRAINAILTGTTARTALLTTRGHPDVLLLREGGRTEPFNWSYGYPDPYVPRSLTFELEERIGSQGEVVLPLEESSTLETIEELRRLGVESVAVCLLWSIANPEHELAVGRLLERNLTGIPFTLSHRLNPTLREYRRASSAAIDASLKPLMTSYLGDLEGRLRDHGFAGRLLMITSRGGVVEAADMADAPIHSLNSGPAMAPVAGRHYAELDGLSESAVVADCGGTSYDVTLVRRGAIPVTRETWLGIQYEGHITGFPAVDVKSVGAGGGSIAWLDEGSLLHVGPGSAGADPGPVCYGRGGSDPTVTDAAVALGHIDPEFFLGGSMALDAEASVAAIRAQVADPLGLSVDEAAAAIMSVATERMIQSIEEITVNQGVDPRSAVVIGGGGAAGLNAVAIARRLDAPRVVIPEAGAVLSARGALMSDMVGEFATAFFSASDGFDHESARGARSRADPEMPRSSPSAAESIPSPDRAGRGGPLPPPGLAARRRASRAGARRSRGPGGARRELPRCPRRGLRGPRRAGRRRGRRPKGARHLPPQGGAGDQFAAAAADADSAPATGLLRGHGTGRHRDPPARGPCARRPDRGPRGRRVVIHDNRPQPGRDGRACAERQPGHPPLRS